VSYGCHNRPPFVPVYPMTKDGPPQYIKTFGKPDCQYTKTDLGKRDPGCTGCAHKDHST
jgi:hypothetical protein